MSAERRLTALPFLNAVLAGAMIACFASAVGSVFGFVAMSGIEIPVGWQRAFVGMAFLAALEVQFRRRILEPHDFLSGDWWKPLIAELGCWTVGCLLVVWAWIGPPLSQIGIPELATATLAVMRESLFLMGMILIGSAWCLSMLLAKHLTALEEFLIPASPESLRGTVQFQASTHNQLWTDVFGIGAVIVFLSVFSVPAFRIVRSLPIAFGSLGAETYVYFLCGFTMLAVARLIILRTDWAMEQTGVDSKVTRRWLGYVLLFVLLILTVAAVLPTQYAFRLLTSLRVVLVGINAAALNLWMILVFLLSRLISLVIPTFTTSPVAEESGEKLTPLPENLTWTAVFREFFFWGIVLLVLVYLARQLFSRRWALLRLLRHTPFWRWMAGLLRRWKKDWTAWTGGLARSARDTWRAWRDNLGGRLRFERGGFLSLRRLDPRQRIRFYYFALLRREAERGTARGPAQTPREYGADLSRETPQFESELGEMTRAFEEARYTVHAVDADQARQVRRVWDTIRTSFRSAKQGSGAPRKTAAEPPGGRRRA